MENLSDFTSLKIGGPARKLVHAKTESELIDFVKSADVNEEPLLILGGGSNVLIGDDGFAGTVVIVETKGNQLEVDACSGGMIEVSAGEDWDAFVLSSINKGFAGLETLSGIPGTVGGSPIQNIGAYGHEVSETIARVKTYDRKSKEIKSFSATECEFSYRDSIFKRTNNRYVVLTVTFQLRIGEHSDAITYPELAKELQIEVGSKASTKSVRQAVLKIRERKGMLLGKSNQSLKSAGSFFVNPIITKLQADKLPAGAPKWQQPNGNVKTSAAWLLENAGVKRGEQLSGAKVSDLHVLAFTNSGSATAKDMVALARSAKAKVKEKFGIELQPEVQLIGCDLD